TQTVLRCTPQAHHPPTGSRTPPPATSPSCSSNWTPRALQGCHRSAEPELRHSTPTATPPATVPATPRPAARNQAFHNPSTQAQSSWHPRTPPDRSTNQSPQKTQADLHTTSANSKTASAEPSPDIRPSVSLCFCRNSLQNIPHAECR